jgi:hypothetical protein
MAFGMDSLQDAACSTGTLEFDCQYGVFLMEPVFFPRRYPSPVTGAVDAMCLLLQHWPRDKLCSSSHLHNIEPVKIVSCLRGQPIGHCIESGHGDHDISKRLDRRQG